MKKNIRFITSASILGLGISLTLIQAALAVNITYSSDTTIALNSPAINLTILAGSTASSFTVNDGNIQVSIPGGGAGFTVTSTSRDLIVTNLGSATLTQTCTGANLATVVLTASVDSGIITITPGSSPCVLPTTGGGIGGGTGGGILYPTPIPPVYTPGTAPHPDGTLILSNGTVYLIENGHRAGFRNYTEYLSYGYRPIQIVTASIGDMALPVANVSVLKSMLGSLVLDTTDNRTVYMVGSNASKRGFTLASVFKALGYNFENLFRINMSDYPAGPPISDPALPHPDGGLVLEGKTVWWILNNTRLGFESEAVYNSYGFSWNRIVPANPADLALPKGSLVKFRDGTLVFDNSRYYIISNGKKLQFASLSDLKVRGYNPSVVITASLSGYESGGTVQ